MIRDDKYERGTSPHNLLFSRKIVIDLFWLNGGMSLSVPVKTLFDNSLKKQRLIRNHQNGGWQKKRTYNLNLLISANRMGEFRTVNYLTAICVTTLDSTINFHFVGSLISYRINISFCKSAYNVFKCCARPIWFGIVPVRLFFLPMLRQ